MDMTRYQKEALAFAVYPDRGVNVMYPVLGLCGEAGEVAEKVKKTYRDHGGVFDFERKQAIAMELSDVLWYVAAVADELGYTLNDIAEHSIAKLDSRKHKGTIHGEGDNR